MQVYMSNHKQILFIAKLFKLLLVLLLLINARFFGGLESFMGTLNLQ